MVREAGRLIFYFLINMFIKEKINSIFKGDIIGREIVFFETTTSTNDKAIEIGLQSDNPEGIVVIADSQTHGKGRLGRRWISPPGVNLYFTMLLKPPFPPKEASLFTLVAAVAVVTAIREYIGLSAEIKWPNDIEIKGKKAGGILVEMKTTKDMINLLAIGIGINVNMPLDILTKDIKPFTTSLSIEYGKSIDRVDLLQKILSELEKSYKILLNGNKRALIKEWHRLNSTIGKKVNVQIQDRIISGIAEDINDQGELVVRLSSGEVETISAGDVTILKD